MRRLAILGAALTLLLGGAGCGSSESSATLDYATSGCKSKNTSTAQGLTVEGAEPYQGLKCLAWDQKTGVDRTRFSLYNFEGGCGVEYQGEAFVADDLTSVTLSLTNPRGAVAACGWCIHDFVFEVKGVAPATDLTITVERSNSAHRAEEGASRFLLAAQDNPKGIGCRYAERFPISQHAGQTGTVGKRNMPCQSLSDTAPPTCDPGLSCTAVDPSGEHRLCLADCTSDADCGNDALFACDKAACRLRNPSW